MSVNSEQTDAALLRGFLEGGDERCFGLLVRRYAGLVHGVVGRTLHLSDRVDDVGQEVFVELAKKARSLMKRRDVAGWLCETARRKAWNMNRNEGRRAAVKSKLKGEMDMEIDASDWGLIRDEVDAAMAGLEAEERDLIARRFFAGMSHRAIASELGISLAAAEKRVQRSVKALRERLGGRGGLTVPALVAALTFGGARSAEVAASLVPLWCERTGGNQAAPSVMGGLMMSQSWRLCGGFAAIGVVGLLAFAKLGSPERERGLESEVLSARPVMERSGGSRQSQVVEAGGESSKEMARVSGRVVDFYTNEPLANAEVQVHYEFPRAADSAFDDDWAVKELRTRTDDNGEFLIEAKLGADTSNVSFRSIMNGYSSSYLKVEVLSHSDEDALNEAQDQWSGESGEAALEDEKGHWTWGVYNVPFVGGDEVVLAFAMVPEVPVVGKVLWSDDRAAEGVDVTLWVKELHSGDGGKTNERGEFQRTMPILPPAIGKPSLEVGDQPGIETVVIEGLAELSETQRLNMKVELSAGVEVAGLVVDDSGEGAGPARVEFYQNDSRRQVVAVGADGHFTTRLARDGYYEILAVHAVTGAVATGGLDLSKEVTIELPLGDPKFNREDEVSVGGITFLPLTEELAARLTRKGEMGYMIARVDRREDAEWWSWIVGEVVVFPERAGEDGGAGIYEQIAAAAEVFADGSVKLELKTILLSRSSQMRPLVLSAKEYERVLGLVGKE